MLKDNIYLSENMQMFVCQCNIQIYNMKDSQTNSTIKIHLQLNSKKKLNLF